MKRYIADYAAHGRRIYRGGFDLNCDEYVPMKKL